MSKVSLQKGFTLVTALFLLAVIATLAVTLSRVMVSSNASSVNDLLATRAYYAARSAMDFAIAAIDADPGRNCPALPAAIEGFDINLDQCAVSDVNEGGDDYKIIDLQITASSGNKANANLIRRTLRGVVQFDAP